MTEPTETLGGSTGDAWPWWTSRILRFNLGLVASGVIAFVAYAVVLNLLAEQIRGEITIFTTLIQGLGYLAYMVIVNLCYFAGPISETFLPDHLRAGYRAGAFAVGSLACFAVPFAVPTLLVIEYGGA